MSSPPEAIRAPLGRRAAHDCGLRQRQLYAFLNEFVQRACPVIPVLLPDAPVQPILPVLLKVMGWVDFRIKEPDPMQWLTWGITGRRAFL